MRHWPALMNIGGLIVDMVGVIGLFFTATKGLSPMPRPRHFQNIQYNASRTGRDPMTKAFEELTDKINIGGRS